MKQIESLVTKVKPVYDSYSGGYFFIQLAIKKLMKVKFKDYIYYIVRNDKQLDKYLYSFAERTPVNNYILMNKIVQDLYSIGYDIDSHIEQYLLSEETKQPGYIRQNSYMPFSSASNMMDDYDLGDNDFENEFGF